MGHKDIFEVFKNLFPDLVKDSDIWFPNGKNSVRIRMKSGQELIFTHNKNTDWSLETVKHFLNSKKGAK